VIQSVADRSVVEEIAPLAPAPPDIAAWWEAFPGFCGTAPAGRTCWRNIRTLRHVGGVSGIGRSRASGCKSGTRF
jgi:hypothetical protein